MIDTDKYERRREARREAGLFNKLGCIDFDVVDNLLAEVKRLRDHIRRMRHWAEPKMHEVHHDAWRKLHEEIYEGDD